jgi:hypothetical protein
VLDCWLAAFKSVVTLRAVTIYLGVDEWLKIATASCISSENAMVAVKQGMAEVQVFENRKWEQDRSDICVFMILPSFPKHQLIIAAFD